MGKTRVATLLAGLLVLASSSQGGGESSQKQPPEASDGDEASPEAPGGR